MVDIKSSLRKGIDKGARVRQYFIRGHSTWFALVLSIINFTLIFYNLLFKNLFFIPSFLKSYLIFFLVFASCYFPVSALLGWLDYKKGTYKAEQTLTMEMSPIWRDLFNRLQTMEETNYRILSELQMKKEN